MGIGRKAPHRVRTSYARALAQIPPPVRSIGAPAHEALTVLGQTEIEGRLVQFGILTAAPRLWVAFPETAPSVFGYLTGLVADDPQLHLTEPVHQHWALHPGRSETVRRHGLAVWHEAKRTCEG
ncbi:hypothetical protein GCM10029992_12790 [Glycomyces albus]